LKREPLIFFLAQVYIEGAYSDLMVGYAKDKPKPETFLLSVGRYEDRIDTLETLRKLARKESVTMQEQLWDALWAYAELKKGELNDD
jgi:hypothetical protein